MADPEQSVPLLTRLKETGVTLSIDDFGTGFSSLEYLKLLPVGELKIDRSFVMGMEQDPRDVACYRAGKEARREQTREVRSHRCGKRDVDVGGREQLVPTGRAHNEGQQKNDNCSCEESPLPPREGGAQRPDVEL